MKFAFLIMGEFDSSKDYASIHENEAQMIGVASIEEARKCCPKITGGRRRLYRTLRGFRRKRSTRNNRSNRK